MNIQVCVCVRVFACFWEWMNVVAELWYTHRWRIKWDVCMCANKKIIARFTIIILFSYYLWINVKYMASRLRGNIFFFFFFVSFFFKISNESIWNVSLPSYADILLQMFCFSNVHFVLLLFSWLIDCANNACRSTN